MKKLSVIIPLYNKADYIEECINSVLNNTNGDIEVIVVDDGSKDGGGDICDTIAKNDSRVSVIHKENEGPMEARYTGLKKCNSEYVTFVDADDFILEKAYDDAFQYMNMGIDMIVYEISRYYNKNDIKTEKHRIEPGYYDKERIKCEIYGKLIWNISNNTRGIECSLCNRIIKKNILMKSYETLKMRVYYGEDAAITYPIFLYINSLQVISRSYYMHRQYSRGIRPYFTDDKFFDECFKVYNYFKEVFKSEDKKYDLKRQIEYFFIEAVKLKKIEYNDNRDFYYFIFPFEQVAVAKKIVLYGAGRVGKDYYHQISSINYCEEVLWVDKNAKYMNDVRIREVSEIDIQKYDYIVIAINDYKVCESIKKQFIKQGIEKEKIIYRVQYLEYC